MKPNQLQPLTGLVEDLEDALTWHKDITTDELKEMFETVWRVSALLTDIGLSPDRKYTIAEIDRLKTAIEWALEGE